MSFLLVVCCLSSVVDCLLLVVCYFLFVGWLLWSFPSSSFFQLANFSHLFSRSGRRRPAATCLRTGRPNPSANTDTTFPFGRASWGHLGGSGSRFAKEGSHFEWAKLWSNGVSKRSVKPQFYKHWMFIYIHFICFFHYFPQFCCKFIVNFDFSGTTRDFNSPRCGATFWASTAGASSTPCQSSGRRAICWLWAWCVHQAPGKNRKVEVLLANLNGWKCHFW